MENLNAEQIIDLLDKMDFFQGQRAGRELWNDKPFEVQEQDIANFSRDVALIKRYIKELTEDNKWSAKRIIEADKMLLTLNKENERLESICASYALQYGTATDKEVFLKNERADTVRKMQDRFNEVFDGMDTTQALLRRTFDHIVKEMLEEMQ